ncbi:hypothetical protein SCP_0803750 [Sparassis crispa]|uniref:Uncharacterized protein n=1 Tax=Sparassis crispa TaxID=139825 RepID=A0A401GUJ3_9APHY|nr:hypothetical protein SCP_0803750 [Sparassis crispa]GBE85853.1 hypothetical protein SCP_0803750 [Sparassis crispa]
MPSTRRIGYQQQTRRCNCLFYGCSKTPEGYRVQTKPTATRHEKKDLEVAARSSQSVQTSHHPAVTAQVPAAHARSALSINEALDGSAPHTSTAASADSAADSDGQVNPADDSGFFSDFEDDHPDANPHSDGNAQQEENPPPQPGDIQAEASVLAPHDNEPPPELREVTADASADDAALAALLESDLAPAFRESKAVRLAYLQAVLGNVFGSSTVAAAQDQLNNSLDIIRLCGCFPLLPKPATTLITAKRRLGLAIDDYIERRPICTVCFKYYPAEMIMKMDSPSCMQAGCTGIVYHIKRQLDVNSDDADDPAKRILAKVQPYSSIVKAVQRFLLRSDFIKNLRLPSVDANKDPLASHELMHDFHDGEAWGMLELGLKRVVREDGTIHEVEVEPGSRGVYLSFAGLHRSVRFAQPFVHLITNIPGPKEPSLEQLDHILEPVVADMRQLYKGLKMAMYGRQIPPRVHAGFELHVSDIQAAWKVTGSAAHGHKKHTCNICMIVHDDLNTEVGYDIPNFVLRDDWIQLKYAFAAKPPKSKKAIKKILDEGGSRYTVLDEMVGFFPIKTSALDYMHNVYGIQHSFFSDVIVKGYLLNSKS